MQPSQLYKRYDWGFGLVKRDERSGVIPKLRKKLAQLLSTLLGSDR